MSNEPQSDTEILEIELSSEDVALEVGYGILGRAQDIHDNPGDEFEHVAEELADVAVGIINEYEEREN